MVCVCFVSISAVLGFDHIATSPAWCLLQRAPCGPQCSSNHWNTTQHVGLGRVLQGWPKCCLSDPSAVKCGTAPCWHGLPGHYTPWGTISFLISYQSYHINHVISIMSYQSYNIIWGFFICNSILHSQIMHKFVQERHSDSVIFCRQLIYFHGEVKCRAAQLKCFLYFKKKCHWNLIRFLQLCYIWQPSSFGQNRLFAAETVI